MDFDSVEYLEKALSAELLENLLNALAVEPAEIVRKDKNFMELGLNVEKYSEGAKREDVIALLLEHPVLMERPIAELDGRAVIGRPSDRVLELVGD